MATRRGVNNTAAQQGPTFAPVNNGDGGGKDANFYDEYVVKAGDAQNDIVIMGPDKALKKADRMALVTMWWDAMGAGVTLAVGDNGSANRYITAVAANAAGGPQGINANGGFGFVLDIDRDMQITIGGGAPTVGAKIKLAWNVIRA
jgi:hypothetical protein